MSASTMPTFSPCLAIARPRLTVTEDLPTPPLPLAIGEDLGQRARLGEGDLPLGLAAAQLLLQAGALLGGHHAELEVDRRDAVDPGDGRRHVAVDGVLEGAARDGEQHA